MPGTQSTLTKVERRTLYIDPPTMNVVGVITIIVITLVLNVFVVWRCRFYYTSIGIRFKGTVPFMKVISANFNTLPLSSTSKLFIYTAGGNERELFGNIIGKLLMTFQETTTFP